MMYDVCMQVRAHVQTICTHNCERCMNVRKYACARMLELKVRTSANAASSNCRCIHVRTAYVCMYVCMYVCACARMFELYVRTSANTVCVFKCERSM